MTVTGSPLTVFHPSNAVTFTSLATGLAAVVCARDGSGSAAGALIALAVLLDTFDGAFARSFTRTLEMRELGKHLDSLSDAIVFGVVPVACAWLLDEAGWPLLLAGGVYSVCAVARLAYFNVTHDIHDGFIGIPAPVAALAWSTALLLRPDVPVIWTLLTAAAMVLPLRIPRPRREGLIAFACWPTLVCLAHTARIP